MLIHLIYTTILFIKRIVLTLIFILYKIVIIREFTMNYGIPYMGSKNKISEWIINQLPSADHFYDCFGGGGAITHYALLSGKYKYIYYNELDPLVFKAFKMAINGEFKNENRWISREDFFKLKDTDPYVALCFSFGNDCRTYCYGKDKEDFKKAVHYSVVYNDNSLLSKIINVDNLKYTSDNLHDRRITLQHFLRAYVDNVKSFCNVENNNPRNVLQSLGRLESLERLETTNLDYRDIKIEEGSIIYCDPPYVNTQSYNIEFNHDEFYEWCRKQNNIYVSEYSMPDDFIILNEKQQRTTMSSYNNSLKIIEKIYTI